MPDRPVRVATLDVARGGTAAVTILLGGLQPDVPLEVTLAPLPGKWELFRLLDVMVEKNTGLSSFCERNGVVNPHVVRRAPFRVYDAMEPLPDKSCKVSAPTQALRLHIPIAANAADYRILTGMVRKYMSGVPILDAAMDETLVGSVDIWCPQVQAYQQNRARFQQMQRLGDSVWSYTCCAPGGPWLNRLLDMELLRPTLLGWGSALFDLDGFLHWGLNQYRPEQDPVEMNVIPNWGGGSNSLPPGDTHIAYPGRGGPWSSVRFEAQREGLEDFELLRLLRARDPKLLETILRPVIRGFDDYTKDATVLRAARRKILQVFSGDRYGHIIPEKGPVMAHAAAQISPRGLLG